MTFWLALIFVAIGYTIGFCRGWMRGIEETRTYIDGRAWRVRQGSSPPAADETIIKARGPRL